MSDRMYTAEVIADSISPEGSRLTTVKVIYPHAVHKDMLRHRVMNRNVESFRAQPPEKIIENLENGHAFMPDVFAKRTKGMGQDAEAIADAEVAERLWQAHIDDTCRIAKRFIEMDIAKQQVNFLLQDLCPLTEIITATDWTNFFALRMEKKDDGTPVARPEVYRTAEAIYAAIDSSTPTRLDYGQIHLPFVTDAELAELCEIRQESDPRLLASAEREWIFVSAGRCARISYGDFRWQDEYPTTSYARAERLVTFGHMSPFEQQARPFPKDRWGVVREQQRDISLSTKLSKIEQFEMCRQLEYSGNMRGWVPARKTFTYEYDYGLLKETEGVPVV